MAAISGRNLHTTGGMQKDDLIWLSHSATLPGSNLTGGLSRGLFWLRQSTPGYDLAPRRGAGAHNCGFCQRPANRTYGGALYDCVAM